MKEGTESEKGREGREDEEEQTEEGEEDLEERQNEANKGKLRWKAMAHSFSTYDRHGSICQIQISSDPGYQSVCIESRKDGIIKSAVLPLELHLFSFRPLRPSVFDSFGTLFVIYISNKYV